MRTAVVVALFATVAAGAGCSDSEEDANEYPSSVQVLVDGARAALDCSEPTEVSLPDTSAASAKWECDAPGGNVQISPYDDASAAATWVAQSQVIDLCGRLTVDPTVDLVLDKGQLLYEDAAAFALVEVLEQLQTEVGGQIYTRRDPFPNLAAAEQVEPMSGCGDITIYPSSWEQYRTAFAHYE